MFAALAAYGNWPEGRCATPYSPVGWPTKSRPRPSLVATSMFPLLSTRPSGSYALFASSERIRTPSSPGTTFTSTSFTIDGFDPEQSYATVIVGAGPRRLVRGLRRGPAGRLRQAGVGRRPPNLASAQERGHGQRLRCRRPGLIVRVDAGGNRVDRTLKPRSDP